ncbi:MAG: DUF2807 domain-containing protein [Candidatus Promineofilum sp.]|nr:DUF2807 domain-containing protein [Promineifilum sp.]
MKKIILSLILAATLLSALAACSAANFTAISGSGTVMTQTYDFTAFDEVEIGSAFTATITQGDASGVVVRVDDNLVDKLVVTQEENRVTIGLAEGTIVRQATLEADVTLPRLTQLNAHGASRVQISPFTTGDLFRVEVSGAAEVRGDLDAADLELEASGASRLVLAGSAANVQAKSSGASTIDLTDLSAIDAQTEASGASTVTVNIDGILDADADGASNIYYLGNPEMGTIDTSGGSNVGPRP